MMAGEFWLSEAQWGAIGPLLPRNQPGARRTDDRRVISGIVHVLKTGCRWQDCPAVYGPSTTVTNRFRRWTMRGIWRRLFDALARADPGDGQAIDSTAAKGRRQADKGLRRSDWPLALVAPRKFTSSSTSADAPSASRSPRPARRRSLCLALVNAIPSGRRLTGGFAIPRRTP